MKIGGPIFEDIRDAAALAEAHRRHGYSAAYLPEVQDRSLQSEMVTALNEAGIVIAEMGAYCINILDEDRSLRQQNIEVISKKLALADSFGVLCCVIHGGTVQAGGWGASDARNIGAKSFDENVQAIRQIIDSVQPRRTRLVLEMTSWTLPHTPEVYQRMLCAVDRHVFGVHLDPLNILDSPRACYENADILRRCFELLGPSIVSCHSKDIVLKSVYMPIEITETWTGNGLLDYDVYLSELAKLPHEPPLMLEHLKPEELTAALKFLHERAKALGITLPPLHNA